MHGQTPDAPARFEVASVKVAQPQDDKTPAAFRGFGRESGGPGTTTPGQFTATAISLKNILLRDAYRLNEYQYVAPAWMDKEIYDVVAKVPPGITRDQFRVMLQNLLIERFKIELHHEQRDTTVYDMVIAKGGLKMKPSKFDDSVPFQAPGALHLEYDADGFPKIPDSSGPIGLGMGMKGQTVFLTNRGSIKQLIDNLSLNFKIPIEDKTGLPGNFAYMVHYQPASASASAAAGAAAGNSESALSAVMNTEVAPTMFEALPNQLGLKLEPRKGKIDVLVIDKAEKTPIEN